MEVEKLSELFEDWYKYITNNQTDDSDVKKQIKHIDFLVNELKDELQNPEFIHLQQKIKEEKEKIEKDEKRLLQISGPDNIVITGEEFIKTSYKKFIIQRTRLDGVKATQELLNILQKCYSFCVEEADAQMKEIASTYECCTIYMYEAYCTLNYCPKKSKKMSMNCKDKFILEKINGLIQLWAYQALNGLNQRFSNKQKLHRKIGSLCPEQLERIQQYIHHCVEISWIIVIQTLPFKLNFDICKRDGDNKSTFHNAFICDNVKRSTSEKQERNNVYEVVYPSLMQGDRVIYHGIRQLKA